jgi:hypothetical protein
MMDKLDLKKTFKQLYNPAAKNFSIVEVPSFSFLMIDGRGDPNTAAEYKSALEALYSVAYTLKFMVKKQQGIDYAVMPLEGLWWAKDWDVFTADHREDWLWTMMIHQPEMVTAALVAEAIEQVRTKKKLERVSDLRFDTYDEGLAVQIMHIGSYSAEAPTLARMHHEFIPQNGYHMTGKHHEIYLNDPNRVAPEKLKTVLRQPVKGRDWRLEIGDYE